MSAGIKLMITGRTAPHRERADALAHLKRVHGPMVYDPPADAGAMPSRYVQNHVVRGPEMPHSVPLPIGQADLVTEIWFDSVDHLKQATATPYYKQHLQPDEANFVDQSTVRPLIVTEYPIGDDAGDTACKLFIYLARAGDTFEAAWRGARESVASASLAQTANAPLSAPGAPPLFVDGVWTLRFRDCAEAQAFVTFALPDAWAEMREHIDTSRSFIVMADEYPVSRLRRENT